VSGSDGWSSWWSFIGGWSGVQWWYEATGARVLEIKNTNIIKHIFLSF